MIWYLLYPFRGTTEPPILPPSHPLRKNFTQYGNQAARHPVITLLISVAVAVSLIYPFPFLYTNNFSNGASSLPHHVWTSANPFEGDPNIQADVAMRSIWVHGSYMKALEPKVLLNALELQDELLGPTVDFNPQRAAARGELDHADMSNLTPTLRDMMHASNGLTDASWFFHSPLQYWSCSADRVAADRDIETTVNQGSHQSTSVNVTLRHSIVFSGKRFEDRRLVAADAVVITLIHKLDSPVGRQWEKKAQALAAGKDPRWRLYPADGRSLASTLYEFRFQPLSIHDDLFLAVAYGLTTLYFFASLTKLRALKSRIGLILAVATQIIVSIMSSFTICAIFKIDLSKIPRAVYPLVVLSVGLENIFRLINAVIMTHPNRSTATRMAEALGDTSHIALAGVSQNLLILWILSRVVSPGLVPFCTFAAIALAFDFFYLMTFFVAVLSVDVRRTELVDALTRVSTQNQRYSSSETPPKKSWADAVIRGETTVSTRIAGTIVMVGFILIAQWHFSDNENVWQTVARLGRVWKTTSHPEPASSLNISQARTPTAWLRLQDHETAHEVIQVIKPAAHSYIARVYEPLVFVLTGSDRTPTRFGIRPFLPAAYDFIHRQWLPFITAVIFSTSLVSLLMNYLLWNEAPNHDNDDRQEDEPLLSVRTLGKGHALDIVLMSASTDGVVVTVGLDRWVRIWDIRNSGTNYIMADPSVDINPFPILSLAIDGDSNWLAVLSAKGKVILWNIPEKRWGPVMDVELKGKMPVAFFFGYDQTDVINPVVVVRHNGTMTELHMETGVSNDLQICRSPLVVVQPHAEKAYWNSPQPALRVLTSSKRGCVHVATQLEDGWLSEGLEIPAPEDDPSVMSVVPLPALSSFLAVRQHTVDLIDIFTHKVTHTFYTKDMKPNSLKCFHSTRRRPQCGSVGLASLGLVYDCAQTGKAILQTYLPQREGDTICFRDPYTPGSKTCCLWRETVEHTYTIDNPGEWIALPIGFVVGVRKIEHAPSVSLNTANENSPSGIRRRGMIPRQGQAPRIQEPVDSWEVWTISARGERFSRPLCSFDDNRFQQHLLINSLGPLTKVGKRSIAVGLGNVVKIITIGNERFDGTDNDYGMDDEAFKVAIRRRKKTRNVG
ncbi:srebp cleavage activating protein [Phlyctema vagabunda]|uniref:Sterol regulatory element-binding protein cleavage-activating protein n=1 Tax=Phlyctema vagabunda TaxID=108571 RepID=A0ABR4PX16_9HELO